MNIENTEKLKVNTKKTKDIFLPQYEFNLYLSKINYVELDYSLKQSVDFKKKEIDYLLKNINLLTPDKLKYYKGYNIRLEYEKDSSYSSIKNSIIINQKLSKSQKDILIENLKNKYDALLGLKDHHTKKLSFNRHEHFYRVKFKYIKKSVKKVCATFLYEKEVEELFEDFNYKHVAHMMNENFNALSAYKLIFNEGPRNLFQTDKVRFEVLESELELLFQEFEGLIKYDLKEFKKECLSVCKKQKTIKELPLTQALATPPVNEHFEQIFSAPIKVPKDIKNENTKKDLTEEEKIKQKNKIKAYVIIGGMVVLFLLGLAIGI